MDLEYCLIYFEIFMGLEQMNLKHLNFKYVLCLRITDVNIFNSKQSTNTQKCHDICFLSNSRLVVDYSILGLMNLSVAYYAWGSMAPTPAMLHCTYTCTYLLTFARSMPSTAFSWAPYCLHFLLVPRTDLLPITGSSSLMVR